MRNQKIQDRLSWWEYEHFLREVDYTIIGAGIVGLSTAIELKSASPDAKIIIIDKRKAPLGASTKNAGFACFGSISEIYDDWNSYGEKICRKLIEMRWEGLALMKSRISVDEMNYQAKPGAEIFGSKEESEWYKDKLPWVNELVAGIVGDNQCFYQQEGRFGAEIVNKLEGALNPQKMMMHLELMARSTGVLFMSGIQVDNIDHKNKCIFTDAGEMSFNKLIVCTNGFSKTLMSEIDIEPARNQVFITNKIPGFDLKYCYHMNKGYVYFRSYDGRLLIGGGRDKDKEGESTDELGTTDFILSYLKNIVGTYILPHQTYTIEHAWSGILGVGQTKMPIVKKLDKDVLVAIRMGGMGVAIGSFIGKVAASKMLSLDNRAHQLYVS